MRNQNDAIVKAQSIKSEEHLLTLLNYVNKENESESITTIREEDLLKSINRHRKIEYQKKHGKGGRAANIGKMFIISFPEEFSKIIDNLSITEKKEMSKSFIKNLINFIKKIEPDLDIQDFANNINIDIHNDTNYRHLHFLQMNTIKLKNGKIKRIDLGKKGYLTNLKSTLFNEMKRLNPNACQELKTEELRRLKKEAAKKNNKYATSYKILLNAMKPETVEKNLKYVKKLDRKLTQFNNFINKKEEIDIKTKEAGIDRFFNDIKDLLETSYSEEIKDIYIKELKTIKTQNIKDRRTSI